MEKPRDVEVLDVMASGARRICEEAMQKWRSGQYGPIDSTPHLERWKYINDRVRQMVADLKAGLRAAEKASRAPKTKRCQKGKGSTPCM